MGTGPFYHPKRTGKGRQEMASSGTLNLAFGVHRSPKDAPRKLLLLVDSPEQALRVAIAAGGHKLAYIAACLGKSEGYVSRLAHGKRAIPERLVPALCAATGSNLLAQYLALVEDDAADERRMVELLRRSA
jgi:DNA-binding transcriptional regulator YdaS (Cro superfamily)